MPGYGGRLLRPQTAVWGVVDTEATAEDPNGVGVEPSTGYDDLFGEPVVYETGGTRVVNRVETEVRCSVQVEPEEYDSATPLQNGLGLDRRISLIAFKPELRKLGLLRADGQPTLKIGDRLIAIRHKHTDEVILAPEDPPGMYITEIRPLSFGLASQTQNLVQIICTHRRQGAG